jgi:outer membrane immunogenic protein
LDFTEAHLKKLLIATATLAVLGTSAFAADLPQPMPAPVYKAPAMVPAPAYSWTGFYVGGNVGYGWGSNTGAGWNSFTDVPSPGTFGVAGYFAAGGNVLPGVDPRGVLGGGQIGYDWQFAPAWVVGLVADLDAADIRNSASATVTPGFFVNTIQTNSAQINWLGTVRGKLGVTASSNWLLYATGGLAYGEVRETNALNCATCGPPQFFAGTTSTTKTGGTVGAGLEYLLAQNWTVGAEYLWFDLGKISTTAILTSGTNTGTTFTSQAKFEGSIARVYLNYKF